MENCFPLLKFILRLTKFLSAPAYFYLAKFYRRWSDAFKKKMLFVKNNTAYTYPECIKYAFCEGNSFGLILHWILRVSLFMASFTLFSDAMKKGIV